MITPYTKYFIHIRKSGHKILTKSAGAAIMVFLMLGLPLFSAQFAAHIPFSTDAWRTAFSILGWVFFYIIIVPIAFYVGGSSVGLCKKVVADDFTGEAQNETEQGAAANP